ncbi:MAG: spermine synthase [Planctomycetes bacterium]|nr:spermine synthase [Planctomycetota bacterium]
MKPTVTLDRVQAPDGSWLVLQEHDGTYSMRIDGVPLMSTNAHASEETMAELACQNLESKAPRVLIGGLGFGFTLKRVLELLPGQGSVTVAELLPVIVEWNRKFLRSINGDPLEDKRTTVRELDVYDVIKSSPARHFDAILLDVDNSPDPLVQQGNERLYSTRGLRLTQAALAPHGRIVYWSANVDERFERNLRSVFRHVQAIPAKSYPQAKRFTHMLYLASNGALD